RMPRLLTSGLGAAACFMSLYWAGREPAPLFAAEQSERQVAEWVIRQGGRVSVEGRIDPIGKLADLPSGDVRIRGINLVGTLAEPSALKRFAGLTGLRELELPGPQWNPGAGSRLDANEEFQALANLTRLEKLTFSLHFLT